MSNFNANSGSFALSLRYFRLIGSVVSSYKGYIHKHLHLVFPVFVTVSVLWSQCAAADSEQFDLICKGTNIFQSVEKPEQNHLSIDLKQMLFCYREDGCKTAIDIRAISKARIVLRAEHDATSDLDYTIDRTDGSYYNIARWRDLKAESTGHGTCVLAAFSGLPAQKF